MIGNEPGGFPGACRIARVQEGEVRLCAHHGKIFETHLGGTVLGKIDEIMIDIPSGRVAYAVLSFGGVLRMGNKLFAVPWSALRLDEDEKCFILDVDSKSLESAPGFDKDNWPDMADTAWGSEVFKYCRATPYWEEPRIAAGHGAGRS